MTNQNVCGQSVGVGPWAHGMALGPLKEPVMRPLPHAIHMNLVLGHQSNVILIDFGVTQGTAGKHNETAGKLQENTTAKLQGNTRTLQGNRKETQGNCRELAGKLQGNTRKLQGNKGKLKVHCRKAQGTAGEIRET